MKKTFIPLLLLLLSFSAALHGASAGITPASYRKDKTVECIGKELNTILFYLSARDGLPNTFPAFSGREELCFEVRWPANIKLEGWVNAHQEGVFEKPVPVAKDGKFNIYRLKISPDTVKKRLLRYYVHIFFYFRMPEKASETFSWQLSCAGKVLAKENNKLATVGTIDKNFKLSNRYRAYICQAGADSIHLPEKLMDERIDYYKRLGLNTIETIYGTARRKTEINSKKMILSGLEVAGLRLLGLHDFQRRYYTEKNFGKDGLVGSMEKFCNAIRNREEPLYKEFCAPCTNAFAIDWEPSMIRENSPGYDDAPTVAAFAKKFNIREKLTSAVLRAKYARQYAAFRQELYCLPIKAIRDMVKKNKPDATFYVCHGSGLPWKDLDYKVYDKYADFHLPMIYTGSTMSFFNAVEDMAGYVDKNKLVPVTELAYSQALNYPDVNACVMNLLAPALAGCAGVGQWPGLPELDGGIQYAFYRAKVLATPVIEIFRQGKKADIGIKPLPLQEKIIFSAGTKIDLSYPQWSSSAIIRAKEYKDEYAVGVLNLNARETLFTELVIPQGKGRRFLIEPDKKHYIPLSEKAQKVLIKTPAHSPGIWLITTDYAKCREMKQISSNQFVQEFTQLKQKSSYSSRSTVETGRKGAFEVFYQAVDNKPLLTVKTGNEQIGFSNSGGRIMYWSKGKSGNLISTDTAQGGFAMDMFWLPRSGRWSGDEVADMTLSNFSNDGKTLRLTYSGTLNRTLNGCTLTKVYTFRKDVPGVRVNVTIRNGNPDPENTFSYWSHNLLAQDAKQTKYAVFTPDGKNADTFSATAFYPNAVLTAAEKTLLGVPKHRKESARSTFGFYDQKVRTGFIFTYPENFLMNYRFGNCADVMMKPVKLPHNGILKVNYHIQAEQTDFAAFSAKVKQLSEKKITADDQENDANLLSGLLNQKNAFTARTLKNGAVWSQKDRELNVTMPREDSAADLRSRGIRLEKGGKYLLSMEVKAENLKFKNARSFFIVYMYNLSNNAHTYLRFTGSGSSGWVTVHLPFEADKILKSGKSDPVVMMKLENLSGNFSFRNFSLIRLPDGADITKGVVSPNGKKQTGSSYRIK